MFFGIDHSFQRNERHYEIYDQPLEIYQCCLYCFPGHSWTASSVYSNIQYDTCLANLKEISCQFSFTLFGQGDTFQVKPQMDILRHYDKEGFYHITTHFDQDTTVLRHGKFLKKLDDLLVIRMKACKLNDIQTKEQLIEKCKLYIKFS
jgi:hypothetical protein